MISYYYAFYASDNFDLEDYVPSFSFTANEEGDVPVDLYGPRYFVLNVDDYNQNSQMCATAMTH